MSSRRRTTSTDAVGESHAIPTDIPPVAGVTPRFVDVRGTRIHVAEAGDGPPLLLLHGWPQHWWCWRYLIGPLAQRYRGPVPHLPGWGLSDAPDGAYDKAAFAADVLALPDAEGIARTAIVTRDLGCVPTFPLALDP